MKNSTSKTTDSKASASADTADSKLSEFFKDEIKDIYWAENHLVKALVKMEKSATSDELKKAFNDHQKQTVEHVARLEEVFSLLGEKAVAKKCEAMAGILAEGNSIIEDTDKGTSTRDVGLILAAQKVEHYEIATYGGLAQLAKTLGYSEVATILETTLGEEKAADKLLSSIAEDGINSDAGEEKE